MATSDGRVLLGGEEDAEGSRLPSSTPGTAVRFDRAWVFSGDTHLAKAASGDESGYSDSEHLGDGLVVADRRELSDGLIREGRLRIRFELLVISEIAYASIVQSQYAGSG